MFNVKQRSDKKVARCHGIAKLAVSDPHFAGKE